MIMYSPNDDGVTHLNVYSKGRTLLGRDLSNFSHHPFRHPELGPFASVEGLWYWLTRRDDRLRELSGYEAKKLGKTLGVVSTLDSKEFERLICLGLSAKLTAHPDIKERLMQSVLPLTHYYVQYFGGIEKVITPKNSDWILAHFECIRTQCNPGADKTNTIARDKAYSIDQSPQLGLF